MHAQERLGIEKRVDDRTRFGRLDEQHRSRGSDFVREFFPPRKTVVHDLASFQLRALGLRVQPEIPQQLTGENFPIG